MKNKEKVISMFNKNMSAYEIHLETRISIKEIYHYIRDDEDLKKAHQNEIKRRKDIQNFE